MNEKEILELIAGLNPEALQAFNSWIIYQYVSMVFTNLTVIGAILAFMLPIYKLISKGMKENW